VVVHFCKSLDCNMVAFALGKGHSLYYHGHDLILLLGYSGQIVPRLNLTCISF
jgi:hypothetical protein